MQNFSPLLTFHRTDITSTTVHENNVTVLFNLLSINTPAALRCHVLQVQKKCGATKRTGLPSNKQM